VCRKFLIHPPMDRIGCWLAILALVIICAPNDAAGDDRDWAEVSLEDLMTIEVTSVSRRPQQLSDAAAAIYVITREDIRRSGATSIAEALRLAPGLQVASINANTWAISARGFAGEFSQKMLVLIDGRSVYTPLFSGVWWDSQDLILEDIDRIEVIRGPGGTQWGANAVNGVINIITRHAGETPGFLVTGGGSNHGLFGGARYGGVIDDDTAYRVYVKAVDHDGFVDSLGADGPDEWEFSHAGFRIDREPPQGTSWTLAGSLFDGMASQSATLTLLSPPFSERQILEGDASGGSLSAHMFRQVGRRSAVTMRTYLTREDRETVFFDAARTEADLELQHEWHLSDTQDLLWGLGYRWAHIEGEGGTTAELDLDEAENLLSAFIQHEASIFGDQIRTLIGSKFEHNEFTGTEIQPTARATWKPASDHAVWAAVSRAVRTPSIAERSTRFNIAVFPDPNDTTGQSLVMISAFGNEDLEAEDLIACELGYRVSLSDRVSMDIAAFHNQYDHLIATEELPGPPRFEAEPFPHVVVPLQVGNGSSADASGVEAVVRWDPVHWWRLQAGYTYLDMEFDSGQRMRIGQDHPDQQAQARTHFDLPAGFELDLMLFYMSESVEGPSPDFTRFDARVGWRPSWNFEVTIAGQNLQEEHRPEFQTIWMREATEVERTFYGKVTWRF